MQSYDAHDPAASAGSESDHDVLARGTLARGTTTTCETVDLQRKVARRNARFSRINTLLITAFVSVALVALGNSFARSAHVTTWLRALSTNPVGTMFATLANLTTALLAPAALWVRGEF